MHHKRPRDKISSGRTPLEAELNRPEEEADPRLSFLAPNVLEGVANTCSLGAGTGGYDAVPGYEYLKDAHIDLEEAELTDKQLTAVCLVFYGGVKKKRAARAMHISAQALSDHIKAALKKIEGKII